MYIHPTGKCHPEMTGIYSDDLIPELKTKVDQVHLGGGKIAAQLNHSGVQCRKESVADPISPSDISSEIFKQPARAMTEDEIEMLIDSFALAAKRAKEAGFDAVQIHGAHGYLINQFNSPFTNKRTDRWGGELINRTRFMREVIKAVRMKVGERYPVFIKFGVVDGVQGGLTVDDSRQMISMMDELGLDAIEISGGINADSTRKGINSEDKEAYFLSYIKKIQDETPLPIIIVGGMRSITVMEKILSTSDANFISMSRPFICEPDLPKRIKELGQKKSKCISANLCWPEKVGEGIECKCPL
jgi:2,4-dienoyl-CoA reductase-like NADH-dependent reductase (Old Yellow Enzyme family)